MRDSLIYRIYGFKCKRPAKLPREKSKLVVTRKIESIHYHHHGPKIPNLNIQIPNNIQIRMSNDPNILVTYL